jgi:hypothetical protein
MLEVIALIKTSKMSVIIKNLKKMIKQNGECDGIICEECVFSRHYDKNNESCRYNNILRLTANENRNTEKWHKKRCEVAVKLLERFKQFEEERDKKAEDYLEIVEKLEEIYECNDIEDKTELLNELKELIDIEIDENRKKYLEEIKKYDNINVYYGSGDINCYVEIDNFELKMNIIDFNEEILMKYGLNLISAVSPNNERTLIIVKIDMNRDYDESLREFFKDYKIICNK